MCANPVHARTPTCADRRGSTVLWALSYTTLDGPPQPVGIPLLLSEIDEMHPQNQSGSLDPFLPTARPPKRMARLVPGVTKPQYPRRTRCLLRNRALSVPVSAVTAIALGRKIVVAHLESTSSAANKMNKYKMEKPNRRPAARFSSVLVLSNCIASPSKAPLDATATDR